MTFRSEFNVGIKFGILMLIITSSIYLLLSPTSSVIGMSFRGFPMIEDTEHHADLGGASNEEVASDKPDGGDEPEYNFENIVAKYMAERNAGKSQHEIAENVFKVTN